MKKIISIEDKFSQEYTAQQGSDPRFYWYSGSSYQNIIIPKLIFDKKKNYWISLMHEIIPLQLKDNRIINFEIKFS